ncbi:MAG: hypothetical protein LBD22_05245, partial [Spirochaetaceae bacterium]|nr:hypothetical protein [Spirochaetaceae bacterium]
YYREIVVENDESVQLLKTIDENLEKSPYVYTTKQISEFCGEDKVPLIQRYSREIILTAIKKKTAITPNSLQLPSLLTFVDSESEKWFVVKHKLYYAFEDLRDKERSNIKKRLTTRWREIIKEYRNEPSMKNDIEFERLVIEIANEHAPLFTAVYLDGKFVITKEELQMDAGIATVTKNFFADGVLSPLHKILGFNRTYLIKSINATLPFWYSVPLFVAIIKFFKHF